MTKVGLQYTAKDMNAYVFRLTLRLVLDDMPCFRFLFGVFEVERCRLEGKSISKLKSSYRKQQLWIRITA